MYGGSDYYNYGQYGTVLSAGFIPGGLQRGLHGVFRGVLKGAEFLSVGRIFHGTRNTLAPAVSFDEEKLEKLWQELPFVGQELEREPGLSIERRRTRAIR